MNERKNLIITVICSCIALFCIMTSSNNHYVGETIYTETPTIITEPYSENDIIEVATYNNSTFDLEEYKIIPKTIKDYLLYTIPTYTTEPYIELHNNIPYFSINDLPQNYSFEFYSDLDELGRCGVTIACIDETIMPTTKRGSIGSVKPTGWRNNKYDFIEGKYLYNRCHLIGYQLSGENANKQNLITGTRYLNVSGMLPFENQVADYIKETHNSVFYRVTPIFEHNNLLANGVLMEAYSIEDNGKGICFNVYCYNAQPGVMINYVDGSNFKEPKENK